MHFEITFDWGRDKYFFKFSRRYYREARCENQCLEQHVTRKPLARAAGDQGTAASWQVGGYSL